jgi:hypothetical protein
MVYRGPIQHSVVVLDDATALADGTPVEVRVELAAVRADAAPQSSPGSPDTVLAADVQWVGDPAELDRLLAEVHKMCEEG